MNVYTHRVEQKQVRFGLSFLSCSIGETLKNGFKLKDTALTIGEHFSRRIREIRKNLWQRAKVHRDKGEKVYMAFDKLYIEGQAYVWDSETGDIKPVQKTSAANISHPVTRSQAHSRKGKNSA